MKISILGLGWYGSPLALRLRERGHEIVGSTRSEDKKENFINQGIKAVILNYPLAPEESILDADIIILNIPPFLEQLEWFKSFNWNPKSWLVFISSTSVYPFPETQSGHLLKAQEDWIQATFEQWTILRFGGLLGNGRHPGKYLSGKKNLPGRLWPVNLIHQSDCLMFTELIIDRKIQSKIFNVVSDDHRSREEFYTDYCVKVGIEKPEFDQTDSTLRKLVPNDEMKIFYQDFESLK